MTGRPHPLRGPACHCAESVTRPSRGHHCASTAGRRRLPARIERPPLTLIVTPDETIAVKRPLPAPTGIEWERLSEEDLDAMPVLRELRRIRR
jgi:hypothetical protein